MPALLDQGRTTIRDAIRGVAGNYWTHVGVATDTTPFATNQAAIDPANGGAANLLIKTATFAVVDAFTLDGTITISGSTEFTNKFIATISMLKGATRTDAISRSVRTATIGVQAGDTQTIGIRLQVQDNTP